MIPRASIVAAATLLVVFAGSDPGATHSAPSRADDPHRDRLDLRDESTCARCHATIVHEWSASAHANAWVDPIFQAEYALSPERSCRACHAPASQGGPVDAIAAHGVSCAACHERDGRIVAFAARDDSAAQSDACGTCHDFAFPDDTRIYAAGDPLQSTLHEWRESRAATHGRSCIDCHMPRVLDVSGRSHRNHRVLGLRDAGFLARAVAIEVLASATDHGVDIHAKLRAGDIGHAFPTGDMFRTARLVVTLGDEHAQIELTRTFDWMPNDAETEMVLRQVSDTRLAADATATLSMSLPHSDATRISWRLVLDRVDPDDAAERGLPLPTIRHEVASGEVPL